MPVGDAAFTIHNAIDFANGKPHHDRGGSFTGLYAFDAVTGEINSYITGFAATSPAVQQNKGLLISTMLADANIVTKQWQTPIIAPVGKYSWAPGVVVGNHLIVPVGPYLYTLNPKTGAVLGRFSIGGSMTYNSPSAVGKTLYIGNSWGWASAIPLYRLLK